MSNSDLLAINHAGANRININTSGNVGIKETAPQTTLHVTGSTLSGASYRTSATATLESNGATELYLVSPNNTNGQIRFGDTDSNYRGAINYRHNSDSLDFVTAGSERLRIDSSGDANFLENINLLDNRKFLLGTGDDCEIYHSGTANIFQSTNGSISLQVPAGSEIQLAQGGSFEHGVKFIAGGAVQLYNNNSLKLATTSTGVELQVFFQQQHYLVREEVIMEMIVQQMLLLLY